MQFIDVYAIPGAPWKNGGGVTRTVAASPAGSGLENFDWRVSVADVVESGDFSTFAGVDRTIALVDGAGMLLYVKGAITLELTAAFQPYSFRGEDAVRGELLDGGVRDFNVMTRRGRMHSEVIIRRGGFELPSGRDAAICFCGRGEFEVSGAALRAGWAVELKERERPVGFAAKTDDAVLIESRFSRTVL